jgi:hypothetical protein
LRQRFVEVSASVLWLRHSVPNASSARKPEPPKMPTESARIPFVARGYTKRIADEGGSGLWTQLLLVRGFVVILFAQCVSV